MAYLDASDVLVVAYLDASDVLAVAYLGLCFKDTWKYDVVPCLSYAISSRFSYHVLYVLNYYVLISLLAAFIATYKTFGLVRVVFSNRLYVPYPHIDHLIDALVNPLKPFL